MVRIVSIVMGALLLAGCGARVISLQIDDAWFGCEDDHECVVLEDPRCTLVPINRRYAPSFAEWVRRYRSSQVVLGRCDHERFRYEPICEARRCSSSLVQPP